MKHDDLPFQEIANLFRGRRNSGDATGKYLGVAVFSSLGTLLPNKAITIGLFCLACRDERSCLFDENEKGSLASRTCKYPELRQRCVPRGKEKT